MSAPMMGEGRPNLGCTAADADLKLLDALSRDPPIDARSRAATLPLAIPSGGVNLNAVLYASAGPGPHPTILLLHGLPGNEQNMDLAQVARRAGWNVLAIHYRGSWGGPGNFSFEHCLQDGAAALEWLKAMGNQAAAKVDPRGIVIVGHSMGGFLAAHLMAERPEILGGVMISAVDIGRYFGHGGHQAEALVDDNVGYAAGLHILAGTSAALLAAEARSRRQQWRLTNYAARLAGRPLLMITSADGFAPGSDALADAIHMIAGTPPALCHLATDHSYSDRRIELITAVLGWLMPVRAALLS